MRLQSPLFFCLIFFFPFSFDLFKNFHQFIFQFIFLLFMAFPVFVFAGCANFQKLGDPMLKSKSCMKFRKGCENSQPCLLFCAPHSLLSRFQNLRIPIPFLSSISPTFHLPNPSPPSKLFTSPLLYKSPPPPPPPLQIIHLLISLLHMDLTPAKPLPYGNTTPPKALIHPGCSYGKNPWRPQLILPTP